MSYPFDKSSNTADRMTFPSPEATSIFAPNSNKFKMNKKAFLTLFVIKVACATTLAQSPGAPHQETFPENTPQNLLTGGAILETNLSNFLHSGAANGKSLMKAGFTAGGFINLGINQSFSIQGELLIHYKHSDFEWEGQKGSFRYGGIEIPVYAMYHYHFPKGNRWFVGIGPYTEFGMDASFTRGGKKSDLYQKDKDSSLPPLRDSNTGFGIKTGYEFVSGLQLNATYKASLTNLLDENSSRIKMHPQTLSLGIAYRFGK